MPHHLYPSALLPDWLVLADASFRDTVSEMFPIAEEVVNTTGTWHSGGDAP
jgi:hypothetical protein